MSREPSPEVPDAATSRLEPRFCPMNMPFVRGDLQQDIIAMLKPVDNDRLTEGMPDTEFNRKYPPDAWCEEAEPNARVWKICRDEASASDKDMLEAWNKTLDVLLIFAGLFSAVSTAFLVESYKTLQPDYSQYVATFLYSAAVAYNNSGSTLPPLDAIRSPEGSFQSTNIERCINGLWFISLSVSLLVALLSILVKQWLDEYRTRVSRSASDHASWTRRRTLYHEGLQSWGVPVIISCLPMLLHVSLFLFLTGLVLFLRLLDEVVARALLVLLVLILSLYLLSMVLPAFYVACPSTTPVVKHALHLWLKCITALGKLANRLYWLSRTRLFRRVLLRIERWARSPGALKGREGRAILGAEHQLNATAVAELVTRTDDPDVLVVIAEAMGQFPAESLSLLKEQYRHTFSRLDYVVNRGKWGARHKHAGRFAATSVARCWRAYLAMLNVESSPRYPQPSDIRRPPDLRVALGVEGALLCALFAWEPSFTRTCGIRNLVAALRNIDTIRPSFPAPSQLHPDFCVLFLRTAAAIVGESKTSRRHIFNWSPHFYSLVLLVFCATELGPRWDHCEVAARSLAKVIYERDHVYPKPPRAISTGNLLSGQAGLSPAPYVLVVAGSLNALYTMLTRTDDYNIHPDVVTLVAPYVSSIAAYYDSFWSDHQGLSDFIRADSFEQHTVSIDEAAKYTKALSKASLDDAACDARRMREFLQCSDVLAARAETLNFSPNQFYDHFRNIFLSVGGCLSRHPRGNSEGALLSYFLADPPMLDRWMALAWHCHSDYLGIPSLALAQRSLLPEALALALCRRRRLDLEIDPDWVNALFSNSSVVQIAGSALELCAAADPGQRVSPHLMPDGTVGSFLRHLRQLSAPAWSSMCDASGLALEVVERFRDGLFPGATDGAAVCAADCGCMQAYKVDQEPVPKDGKAPAATGSWSTGWSHRLQPWKRWASPDAGQGSRALSTEV